MPVILPRRHHELWLDPAVESPESLRPLLAPYADGEVEALPVSTRVNTPDNDEPACVVPLAGWEADADLRL